MAESGGPKRVRLDDFTITVSPTKFALSTVQASEVKDIAEEMVEAYFASYDWGKDTIYQYMGFLNIESVSFYGQSYSVIRCKGGLVSFDGTSSFVPSQVEIQAMVQEVLDPPGRGSGLTEALQETEDYSDVTETIYDVNWEPTPAPSMETTPTQPPTQETTTTTSGPSLSPTTAPDLVHVPVVETPKSSNPVDQPGSNSPGSSLLAIVAGIAGVLVMVAVVALLFVQKRRRRKAQWRKNAHHVHPTDNDDLEQGITSKQDASAMSEAGSSRLGRLLSATAAAVQGGGRTPTNGGAISPSEATPPQSSSEESDDGLSEFEDAVSSQDSVEKLVSVPVDTDDYVEETELVCTELESGIAALIALQRRTSSAMATGGNDDTDKNFDVEEAVLFVDTNESDHDFSDGEGAVSVEPIIIPIDAKEYMVDEESDESEVEQDQGCGCPAMPPLESCSEQFDTSNEAGCNNAKGESGDSVEIEVEDIEIGIDDGNPVYAEQDSDLMLLVDTDDSIQCEEKDENEGDDGNVQDDGIVQDVEVQLLADAIIGSRDKAGLENIVEDIETATQRKTSIDGEWKEDERICSTSSEAIRPATPPVSNAAGDLRFTRWTDVSSSHSLEPSISDDDEQEFRADESWDFNDNDDDSEDVVDDPFQTPNTLPSNDKKPLLRHLGLFAVDSQQRASDETVDSEAVTTSTDSDSDTLVCDPFQAPCNIKSDDKKPLLSRLLGTYKLDKIETSDSEKRRRSRSAPPFARNRTIDL